MKKNDNQNTKTLRDFLTITLILLFPLFSTAQIGVPINSTLTDSTSFLLDTIKIYGQYAAECDYIRVFKYNDKNEVIFSLKQSLDDTSYCWTTRKHYVYDKHDNIIHTSSKFYRPEWSDGEYLEATLVLDSINYSYDDKNLLISKNHVQSENNKVIDIFKNEYVYDDRKKLLKDKYTKKDNLNSIDESSNTLHTYDDNGNLLSTTTTYIEGPFQGQKHKTEYSNYVKGNYLLKETYRQINDCWVQFDSFTFKYNAKGQLLENCKYINNDSSQLILSSKYAYVYSDEGMLESLTKEQWNDNHRFEKYSKITEEYKYNAQGFIKSSIKYFWMNNNFEYKMRLSFLYENNNLTTVILQSHNESMAVWENYTKNIYTYDEFGNCIVAKAFSFDKSQSKWIPSSMTKLYRLNIMDNAYFPMEYIDLRVRKLELIWRKLD